MNKEGKKPLSLLEDDKTKAPERPKDMLFGSDLTRFDKAKKKKKKKKKKDQGQPSAANNQQPTNAPEQAK